MGDSRQWGICYNTEYLVSFMVFLCSLTWSMRVRTIITWRQPCRSWHRHWRRIWAIIFDFMLQYLKLYAVSLRATSGSGCFLPLALWLVNREQQWLIYEWNTVLRESEPFAEVRSSLKWIKQDLWGCWTCTQRFYPHLPEDLFYCSYLQFKSVSPDIS